MNEPTRRGGLLLDSMRGHGYDVIIVPDNMRREIKRSKDLEGNEIRELSTYLADHNQSFQYVWVDEDDLSGQEREVWDLRHSILALIDDPPETGEIHISETMSVTGGEGWKTQGTWQPEERRIDIHRPVLRDPVRFASTLLHEIAHPKSRNAADQIREFERALTDLLGECAVATLNSRV